MLVAIWLWSWGSRWQRRRSLSLSSLTLSLYGRRCRSSCLAHCFPSAWFFAWVHPWVDFMRLWAVRGVGRVALSMGQVLHVVFKCPAFFYDLCGVRFVLVAGGQADLVLLARRLSLRGCRGWSSLRALPLVFPRPRTMLAAFCRRWSCSNRGGSVAVIVSAKIIAVDVLPWWCSDWPRHLSAAWWWVATLDFPLFCFSGSSCVSSPWSEAFSALSGSPPWCQ